LSCASLAIFSSTLSTRRCGVSKSAGERLSELYTREKRPGRAGVAAVPSIAEILLHRGERATAADGTGATDTGRALVMGTAAELRCLAIMICVCHISEAWTLTIQLQYLQRS